MSLNLVDSRRDLCCFEQFLELFDGEIADTDTPDLARFDEPFQHLPSVSCRHICETEAFRCRVNWSECFICVLECDGPVNLEFVKEPSSSNLKTGHTR